MNVNLYVIEDYENEPPSGSKKTNPIKPNFFKGQNEQKIACQKIWPHPTEHAITKKLEISWIVIILIHILTVRLETT